MKIMNFIANRIFKEIKADEPKLIGLEKSANRFIKLFTDHGISEIQIQQIFPEFNHKALFSKENFYSLLTRENIKKVAVDISQ